MKSVIDEKPKEMLDIAEYIKKRYKLDELTPQYIERMAAMTVMYKRLFEEFKLDAISAECWTATPVMFDGLAPCTVYGLLNDMG